MLLAAGGTAASSEPPGPGPPTMSGLTLSYFIAGNVVTLAASPSAPIGGGGASHARSATFLHTAFAGLDQQTFSVEPAPAEEGDRDGPLRAVDTPFHNSPASQRVTLSAPPIGSKEFR